MMLAQLKILGAVEPESDYEQPNGSVWILGVDFQGATFLIEAPNIHPGFLEMSNTEELGLPFELPHLEPGVYSMKMSFSTSTDWESGQVDDYTFEVMEHTQLYPIEGIA